MSRFQRKFTRIDRDESRLPDVISKASALVLVLFNAGKVEQAGKKLKVRRQGGFCAADGWLLLIVWLQSGAQMGLKTLWKDSLGRCNEQVASLAGRKKLPSPAALSRLLNSMEFGLLRSAARWLLTEVPEVVPLLLHPASQTYDTCGQAWHVFDLDPTVTTLRQRALPAGGDLPEPMRRADDFADPGYSGRKRGDVQVRRMTVQHAGAGVWVHAEMAPGNGNGMPDFVAALDSVVAVCSSIGVATSCAVLRMDGEFGNVPWFTACRERGLPFITRLNRPKFFEDEKFLARLRAATWFSVTDSGSGPQRLAADLGIWTVKPGKKTRREDGSTYDPIEMRVIACAMAQEGEAGRGKVLDGFQIELFAAELPVESWPASDAAALYFGRAAEENRFAQEDREFGLDRVASYHLPGQEFAMLTGLMLWNLQLVEGFKLDPPAATRPAQPKRTPQVATPMQKAWPRDPVVQKAMGELPWQRLLQDREEWIWSSTADALLCPAERRFALTSVRQLWADAERTGIVMRRPAHGCDGCTIRAECMPGRPQSESKKVEFSVPSELAERLKKRLSAVRSVDNAAQRRHVKPARSGPYEVVVAPLLPAKARGLLRAALATVAMHVTVEVPEPPPRRSQLISAGAAERQCRRKTWEERWLDNQLPDGSSVDVRAAGSELALAMLERRSDGAELARSAA